MGGLPIKQQLFSHYAAYTHSKVPKAFYFHIIIVVSSYIDSMKSRIKPLLETKKEMTEDDMEKFGKKDPDAYPFCMLLLLCVYMYKFTNTIFLNNVY